MRWTALLALVLTLLALKSATVEPVRAETRLVSQTVVNEYPKRVIFKLSAEADANITDVTLRYSVGGSSVGSFNKLDFTPGTSLNVELPVIVDSSSSYIPVGTEFIYHWELTAGDGSQLTTPDERWLYMPPNREWKSVTNDFMAVYYHGDRASLAQNYLKAGADTYEQMGRKLLNTQLTQLPIRVVLFAAESEMEPARPGLGGRFDAAVTTCGTKVTEAIVFVIPQSCGTRDRTDTLRHEFTHILNESAGEGPVGKLPSWLDEGTAVVSQTEPGENYVGPFESAVRRDRLIPFTQMATTSSDPDQVGLFYGQSYFMVKYLIDKGGEAKFAQLFATIKGGIRFQEALRQVYGFDLTGFEAEFRAANKLSAAPTAAPTQPARQTSPTAAGTRAPAASASSADDDGGIDVFTVGIVAAAAVFLLTAVLLYLFVMMQARGRASGGGDGPPPGGPSAGG